MPKRKKESDKERWERKRRKYAEKLSKVNKKRSRIIIYSSDEEYSEQGLLFTYLFYISFILPRANT